MAEFIKSYKNNRRKTLSMFNIQSIMQQDKNMGLLVLTTTDSEWKTQFINKFGDNDVDNDFHIEDEQQMRNKIIESFNEKPQAVAKHTQPKKKPIMSNQLSRIPDPKPPVPRQRTKGSKGVPMPSDMNKSELRDSISFVISKGGLSLFERLGWIPVGTLMLLIFPSGYYQTGRLAKKSTGKVYIEVDFVTPTDINCEFDSPQLWMHSAFEYRKRMGNVPNEDMLIEDQLSIQTQCFRYCQPMNVMRNMYQLALAYSHFHELQKKRNGSSHTKNRKGSVDDNVFVDVSEQQLISWFSEVRHSDHYDSSEETVKMTEKQFEIDRLKEENKRLKFAFALSSIEKKKIFSDAYEHLMQDGETMITSDDIMKTAIKHIIKYERKR